jgi:hypothetical protein
MLSKSGGDLSRATNTYATAVDIGLADTPVSLIKPAY